MNIEGSVTIVTGSSRGLGAAVARMLAAKGGKVVVNHSRSEDEARAVAAGCEACGAETLVVRADVVRDEDCRRLAAAALERWGRIDGLVNNAGITKFVDFRDLDGLDAEDFQRIFGVNVVGPYQMIRAVAPHMKARGAGAVVNVASTAGVTGLGSSIAYAASKGALINMTKGLARALGPEVRVNAICPGFIQGEWLRRGLGEDRYLQLKTLLERTAPLARTGTAEEMAEVAVWLLEGGRHVTGETVIVDGGATLGGLRRFDR